ncbi:MAG: prepilin-type N-terminal cleavage/methylation domain-containing protein [bacterium]|nr:prepilin-type N-terminal cleavage/methylation domain-containing protein [bacterium]
MLKKKSGFTLVEILIVIALTSILMGVMFTIYQNNNRSYIIVTAKSDLYRANLRTLDKIRGDIKKSSQLLANYDTYSTSTNSIILQMPRLDVSQAPIVNTYNYVVYRLNPSNSRNLERIEIIDSVTTTQTLNQKVSSISFTPKDNLSNNITANIENTSQIAVVLVLSDISRNLAINSQLSSNETMRNK